MTQNEWVLNRLKAGKGITAKIALEDFGIMRLAARINDLKDSGYKINKEMIEVTNRHGEKVQVARYFI